MGKLSLRTNTAYWTGQIAEGLTTTAFGLFLLFYYNQVLGLSGTLCGIALFVATVIDAVTDPYMGSVSDGWRSRWGRRHPFLYISAVPMAICFVLIFNPLVEGQIGLFIWMLVFNVLTRIAMTLYAVPYMALGAEMTDDYHERTVVVSGRLFFGVLGQLLVYFIGFSVFFVASDEFQNGQLDPSAYTPFALVIALLMALSILASAAGTHHLIPTLLQPETRQKTGPKIVMFDMMQALKNRSFRWLALGFLVASAPVGVSGGLGLYMGTFFWEVAPEKFLYLLPAMTVGTVLGYVLAPWASYLLEKRQLLIGGALGWAVFAVLPVGLHFAGLFPAPGTDAMIVGLVFFGLLSGLAASQIFVTVSSMLADVADEHELGSGKRQEGVFYGSYAFVLKASAGLGGAISGVALDLIHWPTGEQVKTAADIPADTLFNLAMIAGPGLVIGILPAVWCFSRYTLDRQRHQAILVELKGRRVA